MGKWKAGINNYYYLIWAFFFFFFFLGGGGGRVSNQWGGGENVEIDQSDTEIVMLASCVVPENRHGQIKDYYMIITIFYYKQRSKCKLNYNNAVQKN